MAHEGKVELRRHLVTLRSSLPEDVRRQWSEAIFLRLRDLEVFRKARGILLYAPIRGEVDTTAVAQECVKGGRRVFFPRVDRVQEKIVPEEVTTLDDLVPGFAGIAEPPASRGRSVSLGEIDLIVVPGVAFDPACHRLGYGRGYYDRLLRQREKRTAAVGLAYECQIVTTLPLEEGDATVDCVVTENRVVRRGERSEL